MTGTRQGFGLASNLQVQRGQVVGLGGCRGYAIPSVAVVALAVAMLAVAVAIAVVGTVVVAAVLVLLCVCVMCCCAFVVSCWHAWRGSLFEYPKC